MSIARYLSACVSIPTSPATPRPPRPESAYNRELEISKLRVLSVRESQPKFDTGRTWKTNEIQALAIDELRKTASIAGSKIYSLAKQLSDEISLQDRNYTVKTRKPALHTEAELRARVRRVSVKRNGGIFVRSRDGWYSGYPQPQLYANPLDFGGYSALYKAMLRLSPEEVERSHRKFENVSDKALIAELKELETIDADNARIRAEFGRRSKDIKLIDTMHLDSLRIEAGRRETEIKRNGGIFVRSRDGWYSGYPQPQLYANPLDLEQQFNSKKFNLRCNSEGTTVTEAREIILATPSEKLPASDRERAISWLISKFIAGNVKLEDAGESSKITEYLDNFFKYKGRLQQKDLNQYSYPSEIFAALKPLLGKATKEFSVDPRKVAGAEFFRKDENGEIWIPRTVEASCALGKGTEWCTAKYPPNDRRNQFEEYNKEGPLYVFFDNRDGKRYQYHREDDQMMDEDDNEYINAEFINLLGDTYDTEFEYLGINNIKLIYSDGNQEWYKDGRRHRDGDKPAVIQADGTQIWYKDGKEHRDGDKPAVIQADGTQAWYKDGKEHRDGDKPAWIGADGRQIWYKDGKEHRDGDKPAWIGADGRQIWYKDGERHRDGDKPAYIGADGTQIWWKDGERHRDGDKPAVIRPDGTQEWYKDGIRWK